MSIVVNIDVSETLGKLDAVVRNINKMDDMIGLVVDEMIESMVAAIKEITPSDTGALRESVRAEGSFPEYEIIADAKNPDTGESYAQYVEFGTSKMQAQPFIWPGITNTMAEWKPIIRQAYKNALWG